MQNTNTPHQVQDADLRELAMNRLAAVLLDSSPCASDEGYPEISEFLAMPDHEAEALWETKEQELKT